MGKQLITFAERKLGQLQLREASVQFTISMSICRRATLCILNKRLMAGVHFYASPSHVGDSKGVLKMYSNSTNNFQNLYSLLSTHTLKKKVWEAGMREILVPQMDLGV